MVVVRPAGLEPARFLGHEILNLACLPNSTTGALSTPSVRLLVTIRTQESKVLEPIITMFPIYVV